MQNWTADEESNSFESHRHNGVHSMAISSTHTKDTLTVHFLDDSLSQENKNAYTNSVIMPQILTEPLRSSINLSSGAVDSLKNDLTET